MVWNVITKKGIWKDVTVHGNPVVEKGCVVNVSNTIGKTRNYQHAILQMTWKEHMIGQ